MLAKDPAEADVVSEAEDDEEEEEERPGVAKWEKKEEEAGGGGRGGDGEWRRGKRGVIRAWFAGTSEGKVVPCRARLTVKAISTHHWDPSMNNVR